MKQEIINQKDTTEAEDKNTAKEIEDMDGSSLIPLMEQRNPQPMRKVYAEITCEGTPFPMFMIRSGKYKYIYCEQYPAQLYDLESDPLEVVNLNEKMGYGEVADSLRAEVLQKWDIDYIAKQVVNSQLRRKLINSALSQGKTVEWDYQPVVSDDVWFRGETTYNEWAYSPLYRTNKNSDKK